MDIKNVAVMLFLKDEEQEKVLNLINHNAGETSEETEVCGIYIDGATHRTYVDGLEIELTPCEFDMLSLLVAKDGGAVSYEEALEVVWGDYAHTSRKMVSNCISRLRKKIDTDRIENLRGYGYRLS